MSTIAAFQHDTLLLSKDLKKKLSSYLYDKGKIILEDVKKRSAVDSGYYKSQWFMSTRGFSPSNEIGIFLRNNASYSDVLISGAEKGDHPPWYYPTRHRRGKRKGQFKKQTGKLFMYKGRVWAGGISPGRQLAAGGATAGLLDNKKFQKEIARDVADIIIKGLIHGQ